MGDCKGGCGGCCGNCGGCGSTLVLAAEEITMLRLLGQIPFLPVARSASSMEPVYLEEVELSPEKSSLALQCLAKRGLIFYPGGKVEHTAYAPLLKALAEEGWFCVLLEMPLRLAVLDADAADGIPEQFPFISEWYIGGHSLGGAMAASHAAKHAEDYEGLLLLVAYSTEDLTGTDLKVCSVYGSSDGVLNMEKYEQYRANLPENAVETVLEGGCHACFGSYGSQAGDGAHTMTAEEQRNLTAQLFLQNIP